MLAGCKRSTHFARVYIVRMIKTLADTHKRHVDIYQHVGDMSTLITANSTSEATMVPHAVAVFAHDVAPQ